MSNLWGLVPPSPRVTPVQRAQLVRLSLKLASDPDGRSLEGSEDDMAPLSALKWKRPDRDYTAEQLRIWPVDPGTWAPSMRSRRVRSQGWRCWWAGLASVPRNSPRQSLFVEPQVDWRIRGLF